MRRTLTKAAAATFAASGLLAAGLAMTTTASAAGITPCPSKDACLYSNPPTAGPPREYYNYGAYNLSGVYGDREFINNQVDGAKAYLCTGYNGDGKCQLVPADSGPVIVNFTPINSIYLSA